MQHEHDGAVDCNLVTNDPIFKGLVNLTNGHYTLVWMIGTSVFSENKLVIKSYGLIL